MNWICNRNIVINNLLFKKPVNNSTVIYHIEIMYSTWLFFCPSNQIIKTDKF